MSSVPHPPDYEQAMEQAREEFRVCYEEREQVLKAVVDELRAIPSQKASLIGEYLERGLPVDAEDWRPLEDKALRALARLLRVTVRYRWRTAVPVVVIDRERLNEAITDTEVQCAGPQDWLPDLILRRALETVAEPEEAA